MGRGTHCRGIAPNEGTEIGILPDDGDTAPVIAEALPRTRGLKFEILWLSTQEQVYCRGIAPNEGTEMFGGLTLTKADTALQRHCPERGD